MKGLAEILFGRLAAIRCAEAEKDGSVVWECICDCEKIAFPASTDFCTKTQDHAGAC